METMETMAVKRPSRLFHFRDLLKVNTDSKEKSFKETLKDLAESSSLHGVPKIVSSRQIAVKLLWCLLFLATFSVLAIQLTNLFKTYYSYPIQTTVSLKFNSINFPAITLCNMNPVRNSKLNVSANLVKLLAANNKTDTRRKKRHAERNEKLRNVEESPTAKNVNNLKEQQHNTEDTVMIQPSPVRNVDQPSHVDEADRSSPDLDVDKGSSRILHNQYKFLGRLPNDNSDLWRIEPSAVAEHAGGVRRRKRQAPVSSVLSDSIDISSIISSVTPSSSYVMSSSLMSSSLSSQYEESSSYYSYYDYDYDNWVSWYNNYNYGYSSSYYDYNNYYDGGGSSWNSWSDGNMYIYSQLSSKKDIWDERVQSFRTMFKNESMANRTLMGHQKEDMIMSAYFSGSQENVSTSFQNFSSTEYGNCYTISSQRFVAWRSGPNHGVKMTLNLEIGEYVSNFSTGYGIRLVLHEPGTYPLPSNEGITLSPGTETNIGLKMVRVSRLGKPYGDCVAGTKFAKVYRKKYSVSACYEFCRIMRTMDVCSCIPVDSPDTIDLNTTSLPICNNSNTSIKLCLLNVDVQFNNGGYTCNCPGPCKEVIFVKTMSSRYWPTHDYMDVLLSEICEKNYTYMKDVCDNLDLISYDEYEKYRNNFLRVLIYFEDLNYETISQEPLYEGVRFLSDIGGAMGLFLGASVLSFVEFLQLLLEIILYIRRKGVFRNDIRVGEIRKVANLPGKDN